MPHFTIEYSANLDKRVDMAEVVELILGRGGKVHAQEFIHRAALEPAAMHPELAARFT